MKHRTGVLLGWAASCALFLPVAAAPPGDPAAAVPGVVERKIPRAAQSPTPEPGLVTSKSSAAFVIDAGASAVLGNVAVGPADLTGDCVVSPDGRFGIASRSDSKLWFVDLSATPPQLASGTNPVMISNRGRDVAQSADGRFVVACDAGAPSPVAVVDVARRTESSTFDLGMSCGSIDLCRDGSVLVTTNDPPGVRRLVIDTTGRLTDTGETLATSDPSNVYCSPDGRSGVVVNRSDASVTSFRIPGLAAVSTRKLSGAGGGSGAMADDGTKFYARSEKGTVDAFAFDQATSVLGVAPAFTLTVEAVAPMHGIEQMAVGGSRLYVPEASGVAIFDAGTGGALPELSLGPLEGSTGICLRPRGDRDRDGLDDSAEIARGTDPDNPDTDGDGLLDGFEVRYGFDPLIAGDQARDPDGDGLDNLAEQAANSNPMNPDTDGDGAIDGRTCQSASANPNKTWESVTGVTTLIAKGDLQGFSTVNARVPVGPDGYVLQADSTSPVGVSYTPNLSFSESHVADADILLYDTELATPAWVNKPLTGVITVDKFGLTRFRYDDDLTTQTPPLFPGECRFSSAICTPAGGILCEADSGAGQVAICMPTVGPPGDRTFRLPRQNGTATFTMNEIVNAFTAVNTHSAPEVFTGGPVFQTTPPVFAVPPVFGSGTDADVTLWTVDQGAGTDPSIVWDDAGQRFRIANAGLTFDGPTPSTSFGNTWSVTEPVSTTMFVDTCALDFNGNRDNIINRSYNVDCFGHRINTSEHAFQDQIETSFDDGTAPGRQDKVEINYNYTAPDGVGFRPFHFSVDVTKNDGAGGAMWYFKPNGLNGGADFSMELRYPFVMLNRDASTDYGGDAGLSSFLHVASLGDTIGALYGTKSKVVFDQNLSWAGYPVWANGAEFDFSPPGRTTGEVAGFGMKTPNALGAGSTVEKLFGLHLYDLRFDRVTTGQAIQIDSQTVSSAVDGNIVMAGTGYDHGHYRQGATHWWEETPGRLRVKNGAPTSDSDGNAVATGSGSTGFGLAYWAIPANLTTPTANFVCASAGQTCVDAKTLAGGDSSCSATQTSAFYAWCK